MAGPGASPQGRPAQERARRPGTVRRAAGAVAACGGPERSLKRRFKAATGATLIAPGQNLRIEAAKRRLEASAELVEAIAAAVGYENAAFFRRLFRRSTGLAPGDYRRMFKPFAEAR